ncbi:MAG: type I-E CRISPR-associated endonuclease Cas1e [Promethearchaeota archaeon]
MVRDLHELPRLDDGLSYVYFEHCRIEQDGRAICLYDKSGKTPVPCSGIALVMLGPGTSITHMAVRVLAESGCLLVWVGENGVRFYASGMGKTRSSRRLIKQAYLVSHPELRVLVVEQMYRFRFEGDLEPGLTIEQLRGKEGARMRDVYRYWSKLTGVPWFGRHYNRREWGRSDAINRALSAANSCLYGICHAAIVMAGYSPGLGFIHTGKLLSFVYDIADLYKADITIPVAFQVVKAGCRNIERRARMACRDAFFKQRLLKRILPDIERVLDVSPFVDGGRVVDKFSGLDISNLATSDGGDSDGNYVFDVDPAYPGGLWDPDQGLVRGGRNFCSSDDKDDVSKV